MPRAVAFHPEAEAEFLAAVTRYEGLQPGLGEAFGAAVRVATEFAGEWPAAGGPHGATLRRVFVRRFPYFVLYAHDATQVYVVAVAHFRQRPGYWMERAPTGPA